MTEPVWMIEARKWIGTHERRDNRRLFDAIRLWLVRKLNPADYAWCGAFCGIIIAKTLPKEKLPAELWGARYWDDFGVPCPLQYGAIVRFWRKSPRSGLGHVGFVDAIDTKRRLIRVLGGNQGDEVSLKWLSMDRLVATRWPATAKAGSGTVKVASSDGAKVSTNEE